MSSEITPDEHQHKKEEERLRIMQIIRHQKSIYLSSSSSSSFSSDASSSKTSSSSSSSLLDLMKEGNTSLRRLFDMEHTSLATYFNDYSVSPIIKPILLWGSDTDSDRNIHDDPWSEFRQNVRDRGVCNHDDFSTGDTKSRKQRKVLFRTKSYKRLPRFSLWRSCGRFKFRL
ncbi:hypothetical protein MIMGU_mgv1a019813mg, partial [Erythranthe guttata]